MWDSKGSVRASSYAAALALIAGQFGCSSADSTAGPSATPPAVGQGGSSGAGVPGPQVPGEPQPTEPKPEQERESAYRLPVSSGRWVFSANPASGWVAAIDSREARVELVRAGAQPRYLAALPPTERAEARALVLNAGGADAQIIELMDQGLRAGPTIETHVGANAVAVSPDSRFALVWSDASQLTGLDPTDSLQDITLLSFQVGGVVSTRLSVGYRPSSVIFARDERRAYVVCERTISIVELSAEPYVSRDVVLPVPSGRVASDVSLTPDGALAVYRVEDRASEEERAELHWLTLEDSRHGTVSFSNPVTDLDLMGEGTRAIAVARGRTVLRPGGGSNAGLGGTTAGGSDAGGAAGESTTVSNGSGGTGDLVGGASAGGATEQAGAAGGVSIDSNASVLPTEVAILDLTRDLAEVGAVVRTRLDEQVGSVSVSQTGSRAVLYTTASPLPRVSVLHTASPSLEVRVESVRAAVQAVFVAPDEESAIVVLSEERAGAEVSAFALVPLTQPLPAKIQVSEARITGVAFGREPTRNAILISGSAPSAYVAHFPSLKIDTVTLANQPLAAGVIAEEGMAYVQQKHADGQLGLIELESAELRNLTGFELAGGVRHGR